MPEKQRGEAFFSFKKGCFREYSEFEPIQLYQLYEREIHAAKLLDPSVCADGSFLIFCVSGSGAVVSKSFCVPLKTDTLLWCSADVNCTIEPDDCKAGIRFICINLRVFGRLYSSFPLSELCAYFLNVQTPLVSIASSQMNTLLSRFISEFSRSPQMNFSIVKGMLYQMLVLSYRCFTHPTTAGYVDEPLIHAVGHTVYAIIRYVDDHLFAMHNLTKMAEELGYSYNYLSHLFRRKTGMTIQAYVSEKKIEKSTELLLDSSYSITEIASMLNYDCIQSFSKAFRRAMNMSPTEFRLQQGITE